MNASTDKEALIRRCWAEIDRQAERIAGLSQEFMLHPETGFREVGTAERVVRELESLGLQPERGLAVTGVKARMRGRSSRRTVALLGELDGLLISGHQHADQVTGAAHACGHNAQLASMLGAAIGLGVVGHELDGDVVLMATPAEECIELEHRLGMVDNGELEFIVGKAELIARGAFDDVDMAMLVHTSTAGPDDAVMTMAVNANGCVVKRVTYRGVASHAGSAPWLGVNALKAAMLGLTAIDVQRDTFREGDGIRVSAMITKGGESVSSVPAEVQVDVMVRGRSAEAIAVTSAKVDRALQAGADALGAGLEIRTVGAYLPMIPDGPLVDVARRHAETLLGSSKVDAGGHWMGGSTDMGDLGLILPICHPLVAAGNTEPAHGPGFWTTDHHQAAVLPAKVMAAAVIDLLADDARLTDRVLAESGSKLGREEYLARRRVMDRCVAVPRPPVLDSGGDAVVNEREGGR